MSVLKVIEVMARSEEGWEAAAAKAVKEASKTVKNIQSVYVKDQTAKVTGDKITEFIVNVKITFQVG
ncbi:dodecin family protein [Salegentibacter chungangensis]|uniref:Dodecin family protein n=1 Tax=Salegentibacter chungangensis TaxID=1335724 RepID=A0ABW3NMD0_9FLAO